MPDFNRVLEVRKEVLERYYRIKFRVHGENLGRFYSRITLPIKERKKLNALRAALATYRREAERAEKGDNECVKLLMNMGLYYLIAEMDIQTLKIEALTHPDEWRRKLLLRVILLTIYEWDMGKVGGKELKPLLERSRVDKELQDELFGALRALRKAQKKAASLLHHERNSIIAHRDSDALSQMRTIEKLDAKKVFEAAEEFYESAHMYMAAFPKVLMQASSMQGLFSYMINKSA